MRRIFGAGMMVKSGEILSLRLVMMITNRILAIFTDFRPM
jgi:hypothetical protein